MPRSLAAALAPRPTTRRAPVTQTVLATPLARGMRRATPPIPGEPRVASAVPIARIIRRPRRETLARIVRLGQVPAPVRLNAIPPTGRLLLTTEIARTVRTMATALPAPTTETVRMALTTATVPTIRRRTTAIAAIPRRGRIALPLRELTRRLVLTLLLVPIPHPAAMVAGVVRRLPWRRRMVVVLAVTSGGSSGGSVVEVVLAVVVAVVASHGGGGGGGSHGGGGITKDFC